MEAEKSDTLPPLPCFNRPLIASYLLFLTSPLYLALLFFFCFFLFFLLFYYRLLLYLYYTFANGNFVLCPETTFFHAAARLL